MTREELLGRLDRGSAELEIIQLPKVFVGGATMPLYVDPETGTDLRDTKDIDCMVEAASYAEFSRMEGRLRAAGFRQPLDAGPMPKCRWVKGDLTYDIVDVRSDHPNDVWSRPTGEGLETRTLPSGRSIPILCPGRFLAAKIEALRDRGGSRWYESTDFEDIVLLLESHPQLQPWLAGTPPAAARAVATWAEATTRRSGLLEEIEATVTRGPGMGARVEAVFDRLLWLAFAWRVGDGGARGDGGRP